METLFAVMLLFWMRWQFVANLLFSNIAVDNQCIFCNRNSNCLIFILSIACLHNVHVFINTVHLHLRSLLTICWACNMSDIMQDHMTLLTSAHMWGFYWMLQNHVLFRYNVVLLLRCSWGTKLIRMIILKVQHPSCLFRLLFT